MDYYLPSPRLYLAGVTWRAFLYCAVFCVFVTSDQMMNDDLPDKMAEGRIPELDKYLMKYSQRLLFEKDLSDIKKGLREIVDTIDYDPEFESYYLHVLDMISESGSQILQKERARLNSILSSVSTDYDGGAEFRYALVRKNIIEGFVDSMAEVFLDDNMRVDMMEQMKRKVEM